MIGRTFGSVLDACARSYAPEPALVIGGRRLTYAESFHSLRATGRALRALGLRSGDRVAFVMNDAPELLDVMYGALWAGLTIVPLNARLMADDHVYMVADSDARALVFDAANAERGHEILRRTDVAFAVSTDPGALPDGGRLLSALTAAQPGGSGAPDDVSAEDAIWIQYTGGTTGLPKGVLHSSRTMLSALYSCALEIDIQPGDVHGHVAPLTHSGVAHVLPVWMRGGTHVVLGGFDPEQLLAAVERERISSVFMVPTMLYVLLDHAAVRDADLQSLRTIAYGAAPMSSQRLEEALDVFGPVFIQAYGQTEAPLQITALSKRDHLRAAQDGHILSSCGRPVGLADVRVADDDLREVAAGEMGEIVCRGPHVMLGYLNKPEETAAAIGDGWLRTGDVGHQDEDGYVYITDRKKDMIVSGGFNVYPAEVEQALSGHPAVADVCVVGIPDEKWGEAVKALVVTRGNGISADELIAHVRARKGSMLAPKTVEFVDAIPLTSLGKHDKRAVRDAYWEGLTRRVN